MIRTEIYVGLNDQDTKQQKFETSKYLSILRNVCISYKVPFSVNIVEGGYIHESGEYTQETTLVLSLIGVERDVIEEIAKDLCVFFHQESVLITTGDVEAYSISENL
ncbi:MAG: hypothetical protein IJH91_00040 [Mogibacterium sp.]|nr:hypothetical protein [Mogibacterium sp.]